MQTLDNICYHLSSTNVIETVDNIGYNVLGMSAGEIIRAAREALGWSQRALAEKIPVTQVTIKKIESGETQKSKHLAKIAQVLSIRLSDLDQDLVPEVESDNLPLYISQEPRQEPNATIGEPVPTTRRRIPIYGHAAGGQDGKFILNGEKIGEILAPPSLESVTDAYSVYVHGDSMVPRYEPGEVVHVHPHRPARSGDYVVIQIAGDEEGELAGFVKRFVSRNAKELVVEQLNPPPGHDSLMHFPSDKVMSVHKIVGSGEG